MAYDQVMIVGKARLLSSILSLLKTGRSEFFRFITAGFIRYGGLGPDELQGRSKK